MAEDWSQKNLPRANKDIAPSVYDDKEEAWTIIRGRDGRMWVRDDNLESLMKDIKKSSESNYVGYEDDDKPSDDVLKGSTFLELDTGDVYVYDGDEWVRL